MGEELGLAANAVHQAKFRVLKRLPLSPRFHYFPNGVVAPLVVTPDGRTLLFVYEVLLVDGSAVGTFVDRYDLAGTR